MELKLDSKKFLVNARLGMYLAFRQLKRSNRSTNLLIVFVMVLTFLNLTVVSGVLVGLVEGLVQSQHDRYTSDIIISTLSEKNYIENSPRIISIAKSLPEFEDYTTRYEAGGRVEANYESKVRESDKGNIADASFLGIDPEKENEITHLKSFVVEGEYLSPDDFDKVLVGQQYLRQYQDYEAPGYTPLNNVHVGTKIRVTVAGVLREVTVKGVVKSKIDQVDRVIFFPLKEFKSIVGRNDDNANELILKLKSGSDINKVKEKLLNSGVGEIARVQTFEEAQSKFVKDVKVTFSILSIFISSIGLIVASITIFIVIFINAVTRRKYIGILEGIGINSLAIKIAYVIQSLFYAAAGVIVGSILLFVFLKPYFTAHPIDFPFSDGVLVASVFGTFMRSVLLFTATFIAGYVPASYIAKQNVLDAILGR